MRDFVQATEYDAHMYEKFQYLFLYTIFVQKHFKFWFLEIFYGGILHKYKLGQVSCQDILLIILNKFISYFSKVYWMIYEFYKFRWFYKDFLKKKGAYLWKFETSRGLGLKTFLQQRIAGWFLPNPRA
jgi:hypothetical protein